MTQTDSEKDLINVVNENILRARQMVVGRDSMFLIARALLENKLAERSKILIVGAGWGDEISLLAAPNPEWQFVGADLSEEMLKLARARFAHENLPNKIELHQTQIGELPDENFDAATCILTLHFVADDGAKLSMLKAIRQRLKSGAPFFLADAVLEKNADVFQENLAAWKRHAQNNGCLPVAVGKMDENMKNLPFVTEERELELLHQAGFASARKVFQGIFINGWLAIA